MTEYRLDGGPLHGQMRAWDGRLGQVVCEMVPTGNPPAFDNDGPSIEAEAIEACYVCMQEKDHPRGALYYRHQATHDAQP
jgi:hypothetical protein